MAFCVCVCVCVCVREGESKRACHLLSDQLCVHTPSQSISVRISVVAAVPTLSVVLYVSLFLSLSRALSNRKRCDSSIIVPPLSFAKDGLYHPVFIIPEQVEQCVFATEVRTHLPTQTHRSTFMSLKETILVSVKVFSLFFGPVRVHADSEHRGETSK